MLQESQDSGGLSFHRDRDQFDVGSGDQISNWGCAMSFRVIGYSPFDGAVKIRGSSWQTLT